MTTSVQETDRRGHERIRLSPMHTPVMVQSVDDLSVEGWQGHAYDISETGVRIELDEPVDVGREVALHLELPGQTTRTFVAGEVVWVNDDQDDPGPRRMALRFTDFLSEGDRARLLAFLGVSARRAAA